MKVAWKLLVLFFVSCTSSTAPTVTAPSLLILGTVQDAGAPHIGCSKECCRERFAQNDRSLRVVSLGIIDPTDGRTALIEASPDLPSQAAELQRVSGGPILPDAIFLTHAHIGHYSGLMYLGKEGKGARHMRVHAMPRMADFLCDNGPWGQLVSDSNIVINELYQGDTQRFSSTISLTPLKVPHRDEYSETVGYQILGPHSKVLFIPDIDKWERWDQDIRKWIQEVDLAFIDATFYSGVELGDRDMSTIPHPSIEETMDLLASLPASERDKVHFIHLNHTNPALRPDSPERKAIEAAGFHVAEQGDIHPL